MFNTALIEEIKDGQIAAANSGNAGELVNLLNQMKLQQSRLIMLKNVICMVLIGIIFSVYTFLLPMHSLVLIAFKAPIFVSFGIMFLIVTIHQMKSIYTTWSTLAKSSLIYAVFIPISNWIMTLKISPAAVLILPDLVHVLNIVFIGWVMLIILRNFCNIVFKRWSLYLDNSLSKPLIQAVQYGHAACVRLLLASGANVEASHQEGWTALMYAAYHGHVEIVSVLLQAGANVEISHPLGWTALNIAAQYGHVACVRLLLASGANVEASHQEGWTALMYAAWFGHEACMSLLLASGANVDAVDNGGRTALILASEKGDEACVNALIQAGATVDADSWGMTALMYAAWFGHEACMSLLLASGATVDADSWGMTALMYAAKNGHTACVNILIQAGANVDHVDNEGWTAWSLTTSDDVREILSHATVIQTVMKAIKDLGRGDALTLNLADVHDLVLSQELVVSWRTEEFFYEFPLRHYPAEIQMTLIKRFGSNITYTIKAHQTLNQHALMKLLEQNSLPLDVVEVNFNIQDQANHCELPYVGLSKHQKDDLKEDLRYELYAHYSLSPLASNQAQVLFLEKNILRNQVESYELHPSICTEGSENGHVLELLFALHPYRTQDPIEGGAQKDTTDVPGLLNLPMDILSQVVRQLNLSARDTIATIARLRRTCKALKGCFPPIKPVMIESNEADQGSAVTDSSQLTGGALPMASGSYDPPSEQHPRSATLENGPSSLRLQLKAHGL